MGNVTLYLPDFFLPTLRLRDETPGVFFEVKGQHDRTADAKATILGHLTTRPVVIAEVAPLPRWGETGLYQHYPWWDNYMLFMRCVRCGETKIEFSESSYMICPACGAEATDDHQTLGEAMHAAREKRFERRESHA
jgi:hypothetical protein